MPTKVTIKRQFNRDVKQLKKKYPAISSEVRKLVIQLEHDERPGNLIPNSGYEVYKVRLANPSSQKGKSGGFRVIYYIRLADNIALLTIYSKTDYEDIPLHRIQSLIEDALSEETENNHDDEE
jgi:mRNA-degrading endonuclease RelE of RelBE toxin-antitoxin system